MKRDGADRILIGRNRRGRAFDPDAQSVRRLAPLDSVISDGLMTDEQDGDNS
jgi:hypothetical protein